MLNRNSWLLATAGAIFFYALYIFYRRIAYRVSAFSEQ